MYVLYTRIFFLAGSNQTSALPSDETNGKTSDANDKDNVVDDIYCGIGSCRPNFAQVVTKCGCHVYYRMLEMCGL